MTNKETSAGIIPFSFIDGELHILIVNARTGDWEFPKGGVEGAEELQQTALREVTEEVGVDDVRLVDGFSIDYSYYFYWEGDPVDKTVHLYLGEVFSPDNVTLSEEHSAYKWLTPDEALEQVTHDGMRNALSAGLAHLESEGIIS